MLRRYDFAVPGLCARPLEFARYRMRARRRGAGRLAVTVEAGVVAYGRSESEPTPDMTGGGHSARLLEAGSQGRAGRCIPVREDAGPEWAADQRAECDRVGLENVARAEALLS